MNMAKKNAPKRNLIDIPVANIELNPENPRLAPRDDGSAWSQATMLAHFAADKGVRDLARDIGQAGLNPTKRFIAQPSDKASRYVVLEGNRRLAALRLLHDPALAGSSASQTFFKNLKHASDAILPTSIDAIVLTFDEAKHWLEIEHTKGQGGRSTVSWEVHEHTRFTRLVKGEARHGRSLALLDVLQERGLIDTPTFKRVPLTTLDRILTDKDVRATLGWTAQMPPTSVASGPLLRIVNDLASGMPVSQVMGKTDRAKYVAKVLANPTKPNFVAPKKAAAATSASTTAARSTPVDWKRKFVIPNGFASKSKVARTRELVKELKELPVDQFENAAAMLMRCLLELSLIEYAAKHRLTLKPNRFGGIDLKAAVSEICQHLVKRDVASNAAFRDIRTAMKDPDHFMSVETFHNYAHSTFAMPNKKDLNRSWTAYEPFFSALIGATSV